MNHYITDEFYRDPNLRHRLFMRARAERARSLQAGAAWLKGRVSALFRICIGPLSRTERLI